MLIALIEKAGETTWIKPEVIIIESGQEIGRVQLSDKENQDGLSLDSETILEVAEKTAGCNNLTFEIVEAGRSLNGDEFALDEEQDDFRAHIEASETPVYRD